MDNNSELHFFSCEKKYGELSNFYVLNKPIIYQAMVYETSEHLYHALKYLEDPTVINLEFADVIRKAKTPYMAKILAKQKCGDTYKWRLDLNKTIKKYQELGAKPISNLDQRKIELMKRCLVLKFETDLHCKNILLSTGNKVLVEASPYDTFWGRMHGKGRNELGKLLMQIRSEIQSTFDT